MIAFQFVQTILIAELQTPQSHYKNGQRIALLSALIMIDADMNMGHARHQ